MGKHSLDLLFRLFIKFSQKNGKIDKLTDKTEEDKQKSLDLISHCKVLSV